VTLGVELGPVDLPSYDLPAEQPSVPVSTYAARLDAARAAAAAAGLDALLVYADREHFANLSYLTGYDPRFEESLLILTPGRAPVLLVGNEGLSYAAVVPPPVEVVLYQSFSLVNQDRSVSPRLPVLLRAAGLDDGVQRVGIAAWKWFSDAEADEPASWVDAPAFIVDALRALGCEVSNATGLFAWPGSGLRLVNDADQLAWPARRDGC
jgi:Creatinase/Prolidase N-terminal domain